MFPGLDIGIVITNLTGRPLLMQLRGIDARSATTAARQAASTVLDHLRMQSDGFFDYQGTGDLPLNAKTGKTYVLNRRYAVLYRQVQSLFVMAVIAPDANLFAVADLSDNVGRLLISIMGQKGKRVEPERLAKKYGEVYAALEEMVQGSLAGEAAAEEAAGSKRKEEKEGGSSRKLGKFGISFVKRQKKGVEDSPLRTITVRTLADNASSFGTAPPGEAPAAPPQRYVQPVEFAVQAPVQPPEPPAVELPPPPPPADDPFAGMALEDLSIPAGVSGMRHTATDPFGNALPAQPDSLAALAANMAQPEGSAGVGLQFGAGKASPLPAGPPDMKTGGLYLVEVFRGVVEGSRLARAGIEGVVMEHMLPDNPPSQLFRIHAADLPPSAQLPLSATGIDRFQVDRADPSNPADPTFRATLGARSTTGGSHHFARYRLAPMAAPCPIAGRVFVVRGPGGAAKPGCVVVVELRANGGLGAPLTGLVLDVEVPIAMGMPGRVTPRGEWCAPTRIMRFTRTALAPGERAACRIAFPAAKAATYAQLVKGVAAKVTFSGAARGTLSGVQLLVGQEVGSMEPSYSVFHGQLDLVPRAVAVA